MRLLATTAALSALAVDMTHALNFRSVASMCTVGGVSFDGLAHYLVGRRRVPGSIYADCIQGKPKCYVDDGISDTMDREVSCDTVDIDEHRRELGVFMESDRAWPDRVVCVRWDDQFSDKGKEFFAQAFKEYQEKVDITFTDINECKATYGEGTTVCNNCQTAVSLKNSGDGCHASIGFIPGDYKPELNLGPGCEWYNTFVHEMGHVVGLFHEHAHVNRGVVILRNKLRVGSSNYVKDTEARTLEYDRTSIMHYDGAEMCFPKDPNIKFCDVSETEVNGCVVPTEEHCDMSQQETFGKSEHLSEHDVKSIGTLYESVARHPKSPGGSPVMTPAPAPQVQQTEAPAPSPQVQVPETPAPILGGEGDGGEASPSPAPASINFENLDGILKQLAEILQGQQSKN